MDEAAEIKSKIEALQTEKYKKEDAIKEAETEIERLKGEIESGEYEIVELQKQAEEIARAATEASYT